PSAPAFTPEPASPNTARDELTNTGKERIAERSIRVNVELLDAVGLLSGDLLVDSARSRLRAKELDGLLQRYARLGDRFLRVTESLHATGELRQVLDGIESDLHLLRDDAFRFTRGHGDGVE